MIQKITFTSVKEIIDPYTGKLDNYQVVINGITSHVPISEDSRHYVEIKRQVDAGELTIEKAD